MDISFLRGACLYGDVVDALGRTAAQMFQGHKDELKFNTDHGAGVVRTKFEHKMLGEICGLYFEAEVERERGGTVTVTFIASPKQLFQATQDRRWFLITSEHQYRDP